MTAVGQTLLESVEIDHATDRYANAGVASCVVPVHVGELGIVDAAGAIANAVHHATGVRVRDLPITLEKLPT